MATQMENVYEEIKKKISSGEFKPNENLTEQSLSNYFNASRNTVKKALIKLESENLIVIEKNKGARVKSFTLDEILNHLEVRATLEVLIMSKIVNEITELQIEELSKILEDMKIHFKENNLIKYSENNQKFHNFLYGICPNKVAVKAVKGIKNQLSRYNIKTILIPGRNDESIQEHIEIFNSLKSIDVVKAEYAIKKHIENVAKALKEYYSFIFN